jgi:hypothetical protein
MENAICNLYEYKKLGNGLDIIRNDEEIHGYMDTLAKSSVE